MEHVSSIHWHKAQTAAVIMNVLILFHHCVAGLQVSVLQLLEPSHKGTELEVGRQTETSIRPDGLQG